MWPLQVVATQLICGHVPYLLIILPPQSAHENKTVLWGVQQVRQQQLKHHQQVRVTYRAPPQ
jgi:hypothetical protein